MKPFLQYEYACLPHQLRIKPPESIFAEGPWKTEARKEFLGFPIDKMPLKKLHSYGFRLPAPHDEQWRSTLRLLGEIKSTVKKISWIHWKILWWRWHEEQCVEEKNSHNRPAESGTIFHLVRQCLWWLICVSRKAYRWHHTVLSTPTASWSMRHLLPSLPLTTSSGQKTITSIPTSWFHRH